MKGPQLPPLTPCIPASAGLGALQPGYSHLHSQTLSTFSSPIKSTPKDKDPLLSASSPPSSAFYRLHSPQSLLVPGSDVLPLFQLWVWAIPQHQGLAFASFQGQAQQ